MARNIASARALLLQAGMVLSLVACGGGGGGSGGDSPSSAPMSFELRETALDAVAREAEGLRNDPATADKLASAMQAMTAFSAAGVAPDGSVWGQFVDGRLAIIAQRGAFLPSVQPAATDALSVAPGSIDRPHAAALLKSLPLAPTARVFDPLGEGYPHGSASIAQWLVDRGYALSSGVVEKGTVEELKAVSEDGIFHIATHSGMGKIFSQDLAVFWWSLFTATQMDPALEQRPDYRDDLDAVRLTYMLLPVQLAPEQKKEWHYGITERFVRKYMSFGTNSLVFINACDAFLPVNAGFIDALIAKKAGLVIGWDGETQITDADDAALFAFDRLLGNNMVSPKDQTAQPPLDWLELRSLMATTHNPRTSAPYDTSPGKNAKLVILPGQGDLSVIVPSVRAVTRAADMITLRGVFGDAIGAVYASERLGELGAPVAGIATWGADAITIPAPLSGNYLRVVVGGRISNPLRMVPNAFTKIAEDGSDLPYEHFPPTWKCVRHNATGLLWEANLQRNLGTRYLTANRIPDPNWGFANTGDTSPTRAADDASSVPATVGTLCGRTGWRLPSADEARALIDDPEFTDPWPISFGNLFGPEPSGQTAFWTSTWVGFDAWVTYPRGHPLIGDRQPRLFLEDRRNTGGINVRLVCC